MDLKMKLFFVLLLSIIGTSFAEYSARELRCLVCRHTIEEMLAEIKSVNPNKKIQVGGYRIDDSGNLEEKLVPYVRSSMHLSELMDEICEKMENYARATHKKTKKFSILKLIVDGKMNPELSEYDIIQDSDLNKSLEFHCEGIVEEFEEEIYIELKEPKPNPVYSICTKATKLCDEDDDTMVKEEL